MKKLKYIFLTIFITFISLSNVNASTRVNNYQEAGITVAPKSCSDNLLKFEFTNVTFVNDYWSILDDTELQAKSSQYNANNYFIEINPSTKYYLYVFSNDANIMIYYYKEDFTYSTEKKYNQKYSSGSFTTPSDAKYLLITNYTFPSLHVTYNEKFMISETEGLTEFIPYEECIIKPEEPETPIIDSTLDNFYSIFIEKIKILSDFALENKFVLSAITILLVFVCLELFIYLFKGGRKR